VERVLLRYKKNVLRTAYFKFLYVNTASSSICHQLTMHKGHSPINILKLFLYFKHVAMKMYEEVDVNSVLAGGEWSASSSNPFTPIIFR